MNHHVRYRERLVSQVGLKTSRLGSKGVSFALPKLFLLLFLGYLLSACGAQTTPPVPGENTGTLQLTVQGLPEGVAARVGVVGPEDYRSTVTGSQTLPNLRTGSYTLTAEPVSYQGLTYTARIETSGQAEAVVDVVRDKTSPRLRSSPTPQ